MKPEVAPALASFCAKRIGSFALSGCASCRSVRFANSAMAGGGRSWGSRVSAYFVPAAQGVVGARRVRHSVTVLVAQAVDRTGSSCADRSALAGLRPAGDLATSGRAGEGSAVVVVVICWRPGPAAPGGAGRGPIHVGGGIWSRWLKRGRSGSAGGGSRHRLTIMRPGCRGSAAAREVRGRGCSCALGGQL